MYKLYIISVLDLHTFMIFCSFPLTVVNPRDCLDIYTSGVKKSGLYTIYITSRLIPTTVYCDMSLPGGGWTVILKRKETDGPRVDFDRTWEEYVRGFGDYNTEFIMGLKQIHEMTVNANTELYVGLQNHNELDGFFIASLCDIYKYSRYSKFSIDSYKTGYALNIAGFDKSSTAGDSLKDHNKTPFSTHDRDNDKHQTNCANSHSGGWWFHECRESQLTGKGYKEGDHTQSHDGIIWESAMRQKQYSMKAAVMAIRRRD